MNIANKIINESYVLVVPRKRHNISRKNISKNALKVLYRLSKAGYEAYLVGGGVRDLLLNKKPKDFDIATNATPEQIRKLFRNCYLVGRRFRLAHVIFKSELIEVSTFRGCRTNLFSRGSLWHDQNGILLRDNLFGSILKEDAYRRDFTINSLYYSVVDFTVRDYVGGMQDLRDGIIRLIGNPEIRYREDPVRMLRAIRFAAKLNMQLSPETIEPIPRLSTMINDISPIRLFEETLKLLQAGHGYNAYKLLRKYNLFRLLFPSIVHLFTEKGDSLIERMISKIFQNTDNHIHNDIHVNPAFLFAAMFWYLLLEETQKITQENKLSYYNAFLLATNDVLDEICQTLIIPKRITALIHDIWKLQLQITFRQKGKGLWKLLKHPKFRAAYDLLVLRAEIEKNQELQKLVKWWSKYQVLCSSRREDIFNNLNSDNPIRLFYHQHQHKQIVRHEIII